MHFRIDDYLLTLSPSTWSIAVFCHCVLCSVRVKKLLKSFPWIGRCFDNIWNFIIKTKLSTVNIHENLKTKLLNATNRCRCFSFILCFSQKSTWHSWAWGLYAIFSLHLKKGKVYDKNYNVVRNGRWARSRNTWKLFLICSSWIIQ